METAIGSGLRRKAIGAIILLVLISAPAWSFNEADLAKTRTAVETYTQVRCSGCDLSGADLSVENLWNADLSRADLTGANLTGSRLEGADMTGAILAGADLTGANLRYTILHDADLTGATLKDAYLRDVSLDRAIWIDGRVCKAGSFGVCK